MDNSSTQIDPTLALSPIEHVFSGPHSHPITILFFFSSVLDRQRVHQVRGVRIAAHPIARRIFWNRQI